MNNWPKLYTLADQISALKPWKFMKEDEIFGVMDPVTGACGYLSVMGNLGEHYSVTVYLGERALGQYFELADQGPDSVPEMLFEIPQLMLSFEEKDSLEKEDRAVIKECGLNYTGNNLRPMFRSYRPGMVPWFLEECEQESMVHYLEQFLDVAIRPDARKKAENNRSSEEDVFLVREFKTVGDTRIWHDTYRPVLIPPMEDLNIPIDSELLKKLGKFPLQKTIYELDFFLTPVQVMGENNRPFFSYLFLLVNRQNELVIATDVLNPSKGIDDMLIRIPGILLNIFHKNKSRPQAVYSASYRLGEILFPLMDHLGIRFQFQPHPRSLEMAKRSLLEYLGRR